MKTLIAIFLSLHFLTASAVFNSGPSSAAIHLVEANQKNLFVFKAGKQWKGAFVEIVSEGGDVITHQKLTKRRLIIDFRQVKLGTYTVKVSKGNRSEEFKFYRK
jgi:hypothetical protein